MNKRILVIDDDEGVLEIIKIILETNGYKVKILSRGKAIQKKIEEFSPNLILLDLWMPGIGGEEITKILKRQDGTKHIPIIIISALSETKHIAQKISADDYLEKPFDMDDLLKKVDKYVQ